MRSKLVTETLHVFVRQLLDLRFQIALAVFRNDVFRLELLAESMAAFRAPRTHTGFFRLGFDKLHKVFAAFFREGREWAGGWNGLPPGD